MSCLFLFFTVLSMLKRSVFKRTLFSLLFFVREIFLGVFKWVKLPSGCVVPGSCSPCNFWLLFCKILLGGCLSVPFWLSGSLGKEHHAKLVQDFVKLAGLSSKSNCNICCIWSSGCSFGLCIPVSSLQYQLIGKLLGSGTHPAGELNKIDLIVVCKVGELLSSTSR